MTELYLTAMLWQGDRLSPMVTPLRSEGMVKALSRLRAAKGRQVMQWMAPEPAWGACGVVSLEAMVQRTSTSMATGCPVNTRQKKPAA